jgi:hypothetical protein
LAALLLGQILVHIIFDVFIVTRRLVVGSFAALAGT